MKKQILSPMGCVIGCALAMVLAWNLCPAWGGLTDAWAAGSYDAPPLHSGAWQQDEKGWWYARSYGNPPYPVSQWAVYKDYTYYFDAEGYMVTGWYMVDGSWYYFDPNPGQSEGIMAIGWLFDTERQGWYYFNQLGVMVTGWRKVDGYWYYFNQPGDGPLGMMAANRYVDDFYVDDQGRMNE